MGAAGANAWAVGATGANGAVGSVGANAVGAVGATGVNVGTVGAGGANAGVAGKAGDCHVAVPGAYQGADPRGCWGTLPVACHGREAGSAMGLR